jgi:hypothetical protein
MRIAARRADHAPPGTLVSIIRNANIAPRSNARSAIAAEGIRGISRFALIGRLFADLKGRGHVYSVFGETQFRSITKVIY